MKKMRAGGKMILLTAVGLILLTFSCARVRNTTSYALLTGHVLTSPTDPTGVEGVTVWVESDSESDLPYYGGDIAVRTNAGGEYLVRIFLGFSTQEDVSGGFTFDPEKPQYVGDARVILFYEDLYFDLGGGISLEMGQTISMPTVYLSQFLPFSGGGDE
jgi:hypothetical protein